MAAKDKCLADGDSPEKASRRSTTRQSFDEGARCSPSVWAPPHMGDADEVSTVDKIENTLARAPR